MKVIITSHWVCDGEDKYGKEVKLDTKFLDGIGVSYVIKDEPKKDKKIDTKNK